MPVDDVLKATERAMELVREIRKLLPGLLKYTTEDRTYTLGRSGFRDRRRAAKAAA